MKILRFISPQAFLHSVLTVSALWLVLVYPAMHWLYPEKLPHYMKLLGADFWQYYNAALVVSHGAYDSLYPIPNKDVYNAPPEFMPVFRTSLFNPNAKTRQGNWNYYPQPLRLPYGHLTPEILRLCPQLEGDFFYSPPPPSIYFLWPLSFFSYEMAHNVWFWILCASYWGIAFFSAKICQVLWNKETYVTGFVALLPMLLTFLASYYSALFRANISPALGFLISMCVYAWLRNKQVAFGLGIIPLVLFKGIGLSWLPLLLVKPVRWKAIITMAIFSAGLIGITFYLGGMAPWVDFFKLLPKANIARGMGLPGLALEYFGVDITRFCSLLRLILIAGLCWGFWRQCKKTDPENRAAVTIATFSGSMSIFCCLNTLVWRGHYYTYFSMLPFAGWVLWEASQAAGWRKKLILSVFVFTLLDQADGLKLYFSSWVESLFFSSGSHGVSNIVRQAFTFISILVPVFFLVLAYQRLFPKAQRHKTKLVS